MIDIRQALKDFVATSNSGKYTDEATLLSKFPELKGYDIQALKDFVATSNSGKYKNEEELFSKFPEFKEVTTEKKKDLSVQKEETPQAITTASPSENGSLGTQFTKKKKFAFDETGKPILQKDNKVIQKLGEQAKEISKYENQVKKQEAETKLKLEKEFTAKGQPKIDKNTNKYLNDKLGAINSELINKSEEYVVPQLNYQFGDLGFKFEESGATGDWMVVTAPNGKKTEISLDPFLTSKAVAESDRLKQFIKENTPDKGLYVIEKSFSEEKKKFNSQKDVDASIKKVADEANNLNLSLQKFLSKKNDFEKNYKGTPEDIEIQKQLINERNELIKQQDRLKIKEITLNKSVGKYTESKAQQGTWLGGTWNWLLEGASNITAGATDVGIDILAEVMPTEGQMTPKDLKTNSINISKKLGIKPPAENQTFAQWKNTLTEDQLDAVEDELDDITKKSMKSQLIPGIRQSNKILWGDKQTSPEWEKLKQEDFWGGAYAGVIKSIPAMIGGSGTGGWAQRTAQFYSQISDGIRQEMSANPEFDNVSENEKLAVILPIGITGAVLEEFGLKNIKGSTGLINNITMKVLGKAGTKATAKTFRELVENEVESRLAKGLLTITSAGLAEAETGSGQQAAEYVIKDIYNTVKGKEMFDTPDTTEEWIKDVVVAGAQEAVGGFMLGVPTAVSAAYSKKGFLNMDDDTFKVFEEASKDENIQKAFITSLKTKITQGAITTAEAKEQLNNYRNSIGLFKSLPDGLNTQQKKEAMNLLKEKRDLQNQVDGKDAALVKPQKERIEKINESLTKLSEDALKEQETTTENVEVTPIEETPIPEEIYNLKDDEPITFNVKTIEEVPEQFRDIAVKKEGAEVQVREKIFGLPIGKKTTQKIGEGFSYTITGKEAKDYAIQEQTAGQVPVQSETGISETLAGGTPESELEVVTEPQTITNTQPQEEVEALKDVESTANALTDDAINELGNKLDRLFPRYEGLNKDISEAYHTAKEDGSNPELVKAVEDVLGKQPETVPTEPTQEVSLKTQENETEPIQPEQTEETVVEAETPKKVVEQKAVDLGVKSFFTNDILPFFKSTAEAVTETAKAVVNVLSPKTGVKTGVVNKFYKLLGDRNKARTLIDKQIGNYEKVFDKMSDSDRIEFIDKFKQGKPQSTPELQEIADVISQLDKELYDEILKYNPNLAWKENHFRVLWKKIPGTGKEKFFSFLSKRPIMPKGFFKKSTLNTMSEGLEKGGEPQSTNPITMFKLSYDDGMKYITAQRIISSLKEDGVIKFVKSGDDVPEGYVKINDNVANIYFKTDKGMVKTGEYHIQEAPGRMLNNMLSRDYIRDTKVGQSLLDIKNFYTSVELGLSPFHAVAISLEQIASAQGAGLRKIFNVGDFKGGIKDILTSPFSPKNTFSLGRNLFKLATEKDFENSKVGKEFLKRMPEAREYLDDFFQGGGLISQHDDLKNNTYKALKEQMGKDNYIGAALRALPSLNEGIMSPLFNVYIPSLKIGLFMKEFPLLLKENKSRLEKGKVTREELARKVVADIDNRLGEMNFDNLFWDRTFKTSMQFMLRSVTWKLGNIRQMGGSVPEQAIEFLNAIKERRRPNLMPKMAWLLGLSLTQVVLASLIQSLYLTKDKAIKTFKDIVAPRVSDDDEEERIIIPTYYKDLMHFWHAPTEYVSSGVSGPFGKGIDIYNNKDFYGYEIRDENDSFGNQIGDAAKYAAPKPFSITSYQKMKEKGGPLSKQVLSFLGFNKAPGYLEHSDIESEIIDLYRIRNASVKPIKGKEGVEMKRQIREMYKQDIGKAQEMASESVESGLLKPTQVQALFKSAGTNKDAMVYFFDRLPDTDKEYLLSKMNDEEKAKFTNKKIVEKEREKKDKISIINSLKEDVNTQEELDVINQKLKNLRYGIKQSTAKEDKIKKELLTDPETGEEYKDEQSLKRYNPRLHKENFGPQSDWYKSHEAEKAVDKMIRDKETEIEDEKYDYKKPVKVKKIKNSDGSYRRRSKTTRTVKDANGNVISKSTRTYTSD